MPRNVPGDRPHKPGGQARVLLRGKHVYLGKHGSPESHEAYARAVAEHLSGPEPRAVPDPGTPAAVALGASGGVAIPNRPASVNDLLAAYLDFAEGLLLGRRRADAGAAGREGVAEAGPRAVRPHARRRVRPEAAEGGAGARDRGAGPLP